MCIRDRFKAVDYINENLRETVPVYALSDNRKIRNEVSALFDKVDDIVNFDDDVIFKLIKFFQLYTNPIKNQKQIQIMNVKDDLTGIKPNTYEPNKINLWTFDINEIILYHTNYNRDNFEATVDNATTFENTAEAEQAIFDDIHKNYYEGLDSFCTAWEKWQTYDKGRIKRIADIEKQIQEIEKQTEVNP